MVTHKSDLITVPTVDLKDTTSASISVSCELMKNQLKSSPIQPNGNIAIAEDNQGNAMVFSIGDQGIFRLFDLTSKQTCGYNELDLMESLTNYDKAICFDLMQNSDQSITLVAALQKKGGTATDILVANMSNNAHDWKKYSSSCTVVTGVDPKFVADHIRLSKSAQSGDSLIAVTGNIGGNESYYQITDNKSAVEMHLPENAKSLTQLEAGYCYGQQANFFLYPLGASQTLECTTIKDAYQGVLTYDFSPGNHEIPQAYRDSKYNCFTTSVEDTSNPLTTSSDVYIGTDKGIFVFKKGKIKNGGFQLVTDEIKDVHQLIVKEHNGQISIWAMSSPSNLNFIKGVANGDTYTFNHPVLFEKDCLHVAPMRNQKKGSNELYLVNQEENLVHIWQDPTSTIWQERTITIKDQGYLFNFDSFTSHIKIVDEKGLSITDQTVGITSSEWTFVTINGKVYSLDKDVPVEVTPDYKGSIDIIYMTKNIAPPILHLSAGYLSKNVNIYQNGKILNGVSKITTGADIQNAKDSDGKPVLTESQSSQTLDGVAGNLQQLVGSSKKTGTTPEGCMFVSLTGKDAKETGALSLSHLPNNFSMGMKTQNGQWQPHAANGYIQTGNIFSDIINDAGDAFRWIDNAFHDLISVVKNGVITLKDGISFVIHKISDTVLHFVLTIADKVLTIVVDTLIKVFKVVNWLFSLIGIDLSAILRWLGHLLGLDTIWRTHKVIAALLNNSINYGADFLKDNIQDLKTLIDDSITNIEKDVTGKTAPSDVGSKSAFPEISLPSDPLNFAPTNWIMSQIMHCGLLDGGSSSGGGQSVASVVGYMENTVEKGMNEVMNDLFGLGEQLMKGIMSLNIEDLHNACNNSFDLIMDAIKTIITGVLDVLQDIITLMQDLLTQPLNIPFLGEMYKFFCELMGEKEELTFTNAVSWIIAIPFSVIYKIGTGASAFANGDTYGMESPDYFNNLFGKPKDDLVVAGSSNDGYVKIGGAIADSGMLISNVLTQLDYADKGAGSEVTGPLNALIKILRDGLTFPVEKKKKDLLVASWFVGFVFDIVVMGYNTTEYKQYNKELSTTVKGQEFKGKITDIIGITKNTILGTMLLVYNIEEKSKASEYIRNIFSSYGSVVNGVAGSVNAIRVQIVSALFVMAGSCDGLFSTLDGKSDNNVNTGG
jgi:hypothetical protein